LAVGGWQLAVGSWQLAVGGWQLAVGSWQLAVGSYRLAVGGKDSHSIEQATYTLNGLKLNFLDRITGLAGIVW
jgi:hypothetical protein